MHELKMEVWFDGQGLPEARLSDTAPKGRAAAQLNESLLFAFFAVRQLGNMGGHWTAQALADMLLDVDVASPIADAQGKLAELVQFAPTIAGRHGFIATFRPDGSGYFKLDIRGMRRGKNVGYFAPTSTLAVLAYLLKRRPDDAAYQAALATTAILVGRAKTDGLINLASRSEVATQTALMAWETIDAITDEPAPEDGRGSDEEPETTVREYDHAASIAGIKAELTSKTAIHAKIGERVIYQNAPEGIQLAFRVAAIHDPIEPTRDHFGVPEGHRYVGITLEVENVADAGGQWLFVLSAGVVGEAGEFCGWSRAGREPYFQHALYLTPGMHASGFELFDVPEHTRVERVLIGLNETPLAIAWDLEAG